MAFPAAGQGCHEISAEAEWQVVEKNLEQAENVRVITENGSREDAYLDCGMETVNGTSCPDGDPARRKRVQGGRDRVREVDRQAEILIVDAGR